MTPVVPLSLDNSPMCTIGFTQNTIPLYTFSLYVSRIALLRDYTDIVIKDVCACAYTCV